MIKPNQKLEAVAVGIKPITSSPITVEFFNGDKYTGSDGIEYPGYSSVVFPEGISTDSKDSNYIEPEVFEKLAIDAYYSIDAYVNKAMTVLGMFNEVPNFSSIPVITKDHMMRAIAAKMEQSIWTEPANAEIKVTLTQSSGGRTTNIPGRENFNPSDVLNEAVKEYINGSMIFEILQDSFQAILLDRNNYYTKDEIDAILTSGKVPVEVLYTKDVATWEPTDPGDGVNKKYVDTGDAELQAQINALIVGDIELNTGHISVLNPEFESYTGLAVEQNEVNIENAAITNILNTEVNNLKAKIGMPLAAYKTLGKSVTSVDGVVIVDNYDDETSGTIDTWESFDPTTGKYTIPSDMLGDLMTIDVQAKVTGKPLPGQISGKAYLYKNDSLLLHPITGLPVETSFTIETTAGSQISLVATDVVIRDAGTDGDEVKVGDTIDVRFEQSNLSGSSGIPIIISDIRFDFVYKRKTSNEYKLINTEEVIVKNPVVESLSGTAGRQDLTNTEFVDKFAEIEATIATLQADVTARELPINSIVISPTAPAYGTWEDVGELYDGQAIIGGTNSNGDVKSHDHSIKADWFGPLRSPDGKIPGEVATSGDIDVSFNLETFDDIEAEEFRNYNVTVIGLQTGTTGTSRNFAYGIGIGDGNHIWRRIS